MEWILRIFFRDILQKAEQFELQQENFKKLQKENDYLKTELVNFKRKRMKLDELLTGNSDDIISIEKTWKNVEVAVRVHQEKNTVEVTLWRLNVPTKNKRCIAIGLIDKEAGKLNIESLQIPSLHQNKGYGTIAISKLVQLAGKLELQEITGVMKEDILPEYQERFNHFCNKLGFRVHVYADTKSILVSRVINY